VLSYLGSTKSVIYSCEGGKPKKGTKGSRWEEGKKGLVKKEEHTLGRGDGRGLGNHLTRLQATSQGARGERPTRGASGFKQDDSKHTHVKRREEREGGWKTVKSSRKAVRINPKPKL